MNTIDLHKIQDTGFVLGIIQSIDILLGKGFYVACGGLISGLGGVERIRMSMQESQCTALGLTLLDKFESWLEGENDKK